MSRRYLIIVSVVAHAAVAIGLFVSGIWKLERLDYRHRVSLTLGAMMPAGDGGGGEGERQEKKQAEKKKDKKKQKTKVQLRQVEKLETDKPDESELDTTGGGGGDGDTEGPGTGTTPGGGGGTCDPLVDPDQCGGAPIVHTVTCGDGIEETPEQCDDGNLRDGDKCSSTCTIEQIVVPPSIFAGLRMSGETQIVPPDPVKTTMLRDGMERTTGSFKMCLDTSGRITSISRLGRGTGYEGYDAKITATMRTWRYQPYRVNNAPMPVCSVVTFVYTIK